MEVHAGTAGFFFSAQDGRRSVRRVAGVLNFPLSFSGLYGLALSLRAQSVSLYVSGGAERQEQKLDRKLALL